MPEEIKLDLCAQRTEGDKLFRGFAMKEHSRRGETYGHRGKCASLKLGKKTKIAVNKKILKLKEDRFLFACLMMVCQSRPEI